MAAGCEQCGAVARGSDWGEAGFGTRERHGWQLQQLHLCDGRRRQRCGQWWWWRTRSLFLRPAISTGMGQRATRVTTADLLEQVVRVLVRVLVRVRLQRPNLEGLHVT